MCRTEIPPFHLDEGISAPASPTTPPPVRPGASQRQSSTASDKGGRRASFTDRPHSTSSSRSASFSVPADDEGRMQLRAGGLGLTPGEEVEEDEEVNEESQWGLLLSLRDLGSAPDQEFILSQRLPSAPSSVVLVGGITPMKLKR